MTNSPALELAAGLHVDRIIEFTSSAELGELLVDATAQKQTVVPFGARGSLLTGRPATADIGLDLVTCHGILSYAPADLTLSVRAGTTWADVQSTLGEHGQTLPLDIPFPDRTTVGGVVATGFSGARRYRQGSLRDLLIGCEYVRGDGLVANAGGMVVKNVSGFEIPRFLHGSWGALAVLTSVNLKVVPKPRADGTALFAFESVLAAVEAGIELVSQGAPLDAIAVVQTTEGTSLAVRGTGRSRAVSAILDSVSPAGTGSPKRLDDDESASWWQQTTDKFAESSDTLQLAISSRIEHLSTLATSLHDMVPQGALLIMPGYGSLRFCISLTDISDPATTLDQVMSLGSQHGGSCVVESAPVSQRMTHNLWGTPDSGAPTMQAIKRTFDPASVLNRGRLFV